ncbi:MAG TPA: hypothetical protein VIV57_00595 [Anaeromyxobacter sp.]
MRRSRALSSSTRRDTGTPAVSGHAPTFLGEPGTLAEAPAPTAPADPGRLRLLADGVTTDVTISMRY